MEKEIRVVIIGGGFAGIKCALELQEKNLKGVRITLIGDRPHFEYHGALYRLVAGHSPLEVCVPVNEIIDEKKVEFLESKISKIEPKEKRAISEDGSEYSYDYLVVALGAETNYFDIPGLEKHSYGMKTIPDALLLKRHIHEVIESCVNGTKADNLCSGNFVVVGAGATGVELAAELAVYTRKLAKIHNIEPSLMNVELIEAGKRILPTLPEPFAKRIERRVRSLGVNIRLNRAIEKNDIENVYLNDMKLKTKTVIWTAGVKANHLIKDAGFQIDNIGKALVDEHLQSVDYKRIFFAGDAASTLFSGMAQTALYDGEYIADIIEDDLKGHRPRYYYPGKSIYAIPAGPGWSGIVWGPLRLYGAVGWFVRRVVDLVVYRSFLPAKKAYDLFLSHKQACEACPVCCAYEQELAK
jgi:NADH dehydrogenase